MQSEKTDVTRYEYKDFVPLETTTTLNVVEGSFTCKNFRYNDYIRKTLGQLYAIFSLLVLHLVRSSITLRNLFATP